MTDRLNWQESYTRLERTRQALEAGGNVPPEEAKRILAGRAQVLAKPLEEAPTVTDTLELLVFSIARERYGIETAYILEVVSLPGLTPVPSAPPFVLGVVNHRGRILPVLDLRRLLGMAGHGIVEGSRVVAVQAGGMPFGIFADAVAGTVRVSAQNVSPSPVIATGDHQAVVRGVTEEMIAVLDLEALARDPRIVVNQE
ncbi:MAG: chemotaxis protein CheW [Acidobacteria bacterium]|nr:chemotaxis protein CheW [Acidobacteriota bacterium]